MSEIISYHYIDIDPEIVFDICKNELDGLSIKVSKLKDVIKSKWTS